MGLLDTITSALGADAKSLQQQALNSMLEKVVGKDNAQLSSLIKNLDLSKAGELVEFFQKNGIPDTKEEITELISKFTSPAKPAKQTKTETSAKK